MTAIRKKITHKHIFLLDAIGALLTSLLLTFLLANMEMVFGIRANVLYALSAAAFIIFLYSSICFLLVKNNIRLFLKIMAAVNLTYCGITISLIGSYYSEVTTIGLIYFTGEILIIVLLAAIELKAAISKSLQ